MSDNNTNRDGKIVTFYSFKGGVGRTMMLANVAWLFASSGQRVLIVDWDLEAPGLHRYLLPFMADPDLRLTRGLVDLLGDYIAFLQMEIDHRPEAVVDPLALADPGRVAVPIQFAFPMEGCLHLVGAGQQDGDYGRRVHRFDWQAFYSRFAGASFVDAMARRMRSDYDLIFIDSRTGVADTSGICTLQLPDQVVLFFSYNRQSVEGTEAVADLIENSGRSPKLILRPTRVLKDVVGIDDARAFARERLDVYVGRDDRESIGAYWEAAEIPHYSAYAFEETLATFRDVAGGRNTLLADAEWLAQEIAGGEEIKLRRIDESLRQRFLHRFRLRNPEQTAVDEITSLPAELALASLDKLLRDWLSDSRPERWPLERVAVAYGSIATRLESEGLRILSEKALDGMARVLQAKLSAEPGDPKALELTWKCSHRIGDIRAAMGNMAEAYSAYFSSLQLAERECSKDGQRSDSWRRRLSVSWNKLGDVRWAQGDLPGALQAYTAAKDTVDELVVADPGYAQWQRDLSVSWNRLGDVRRAQGDLAGALQAYTADKEIADKLAAADPGNAEWQRDLSVSWNKLGDVRRTQGDLPGALQAFTESKNIRDKLAAADPGNAQWLRDLSISWERLASVREAQQDGPGALAAWREALAVSERLARDFPDSVDMQTTQVVHLAGVARHLDHAAPALRAEAKALLDRALAVLRPLAQAGRLDADRQGWIAWIEQERAVLDETAPPP